MTLLEPFWFLQRLVVVSHRGTIAYDEPFHHGVNIIRGRNSSGKSTIANFIFYALGGDFSSWTTEALNCREVLAEVNINNVILTLKRTVTVNKMQSMGIFWGRYEEATKSNFAGWKHFPYQQTSNKESYTNILFSVLGFPEVRSEADNKITIHQVLRLIYIDQDSPTQSLFRAEQFDNPLTRQAISELLLGAYDDTLYSDRVRLRELQQKFTQKKDQYDGIIRILGTTGNETDVKKISKEIEKTRKNLETVQTEIQKTRLKSLVTKRSTTPLKIETLQKKLSEAKSELFRLDTKLKDLEFDIADSKQFIQALENRIGALDDSLLTRKVLGELPLEHCPQCLSPLHVEIVENQCALCKQIVSSGEEKTYAKRLKQEIELQIKESKKLLEDKFEAVNELASQRPGLIESLRSMQREIDLEEREAKSTRDDTLDDLLVSKGNLEGNIEFLIRQLKAVQQLELLRQELEELNSEIGRLNLRIKQKIEEQGRNLKTAQLKIESIALDILRRDIRLQEEFTTANHVEINFLKDTFSLDGRNNFSASSNVMLKNAIRFAIFFASLELPFLRFPRLILCDNMEDKGMEQSRTRNFQKVITSLSKSYDVAHQVIFTTSMISPSLDKSEYCIGDYYSESNKSLKTQAQN